MTIKPREVCTQKVSLKTELLTTTTTTTTATTTITIAEAKWWRKTERKKRTTRQLRHGKQGCCCCCCCHCCRCRRSSVQNNPTIRALGEIKRKERDVSWMVMRNYGAPNNNTNCTSRTNLTGRRSWLVSWLSSCPHSLLDLRPIIISSSVTGHLLPSTKTRRKAAPIRGVTYRSHRLQRHQQQQLWWWWVHSSPSS